MTEFTKLIKQLDVDALLLSSINSDFEELSKKVSQRIDFSVASLYLDLSTLIGKAETLQRTITASASSVNEKYVQKLNWTDPVTNTLRFGENMRTKIINSNANIDSLLSSCNELIIRMQEASILEKEFYDKELEEARILNEIEANNNKLNDTAANIVIDVAQLERLKQLEEELKLQELHREAEVARARKKIKQQFRTEV
jgi:hypothetical protein